MIEDSGPSGRVTLLMISNFGRADGGRETWAYNFIPRFLERWPGVSLDIVGLNRAGETDNSERLKDLAPGRVATTFIHSARKRYPTLTMLANASRRYPVPCLVIGVGSAVELFAILLSSHLRRARRVLWLRTIWVDEKSAKLPKRLHWLIRRLEVTILRRAHLLIANGEDTAAYYRQRGLDVTTIANCVDFERWRRDPATIGRIVRVAFIGRLTKEKGGPEFLELARRAGANRAFDLHVIGDGPLGGEARALEREGLLHFHGSVPNDELAHLMSGFDVCVALTHKSASGGGGGVSNALLEQMAAGRVILAWDNAIFRQLLDEKTAFLVYPGDVAAMERTLKAILTDPDGARQRAAAAQRAAEGYSLDAHIEKFVTAASPFFAGRERGASRQG